MDRDALQDQNTKVHDHSIVGWGLNDVGCFVLACILFSPIRQSSPIEHPVFASLVWLDEKMTWAREAAAASGSESPGCVWGLSRHRPKQSTVVIIATAELVRCYCEYGCLVCLLTSSFSSASSHLFLLFFPPPASHSNHSQLHRHRQQPQPCHFFPHPQFPTPKFVLIWCLLRM